MVKAFVERANDREAVRFVFEIQVIDTKVQEIDTTAGESWYPSFGCYETY